MQQSLYRQGRWWVGLMAATRYDLNIDRHAIIPTGAKIIAVNHPTTTDPFLITRLIDEPMSILVHDTVFRVPGLGQYLRAAGHIRVVPGDGVRALSAAMRRLEQGKTVTIFPEGGISPADGLKEPRTGAARLALASGAPVIPVGIHLDRNRITYKETTIDGQPELIRWYPNGPYYMTVGKPMVFHGDVNDRVYVNRVATQIMQNISMLAWESERRLAERPERVRTFARRLQFQR
ncbi:MAG: 1-acyl-sn-glycerol-3-phosphate acyltransferase [Anaerolineae bacterium]|nr:1-acyl-sn-glycerol-3-phosphate acyltransferase [Anaerolineae bacterium]